MKLFVLKYRRLIIIVVPILFFLMFIFSLSNTNLTGQSLPTPGPTPVKTLEQEISENLIFETSVDEDRHEFDNPQEIQGYQGQETLPDGSVQHIYSSINPERPNITIVDSDNLIIFKRVIVSENQPLRLEGFVNLYGPARWIFEGSVFYGENVETYIYPDYGMALKVDTLSGLILEQHLFEPTTVEEYVRKYGDDILANPEP